jgi:hypothetical protein
MSGRVRLITYVATASIVAALFVPWWYLTPQLCLLLAGTWCPPATSALDALAGIDAVLALCAVAFALALPHSTRPTRSRWVAETLIGAAICSLTIYTMLRLPAPSYPGADVTVGPGPVVVLALGLGLTGWAAWRASRPTD